MRTLFVSCVVKPLKNVDNRRRNDENKRIYERKSKKRQISQIHIVKARCCNRKRNRYGSRGNASVENQTSHGTLCIFQRFFAVGQVLHKVHCKLRNKEKQRDKKSPKRFCVQKPKSQPDSRKNCDGDYIERINKAQTLVFEYLAYAIIIVLNGIQIRPRHKKAVERNQQNIKPIASCKRHTHLPCSYQDMQKAFLCEYSNIHSLFKRFFC